jgi:hypothetical protein
MPRKKSSRKKSSRKKAGPTSGPAVVESIIKGLPEAVKSVAPDAIRAASKELVPLGTEAGKATTRAGMLVLGSRLNHSQKATTAARAAAERKLSASLS